MMKTREVLLGLVVGLLIGGVITYSISLYTFSLPRFRSYEEQIDGLQKLILDLGEEKNQLEEENSQAIAVLEDEVKSISSAYSSMEDLYRDVQTKYSEYEPTLQALNASYQMLKDDYELLQNSSLTLESEFEAEMKEISDRHTSLLDTLEFYEIKNYTQTVYYTISDGEVKIFTFEIPNGILWDIEFIHENDQLVTTVAWRRGDQRGLKGVSTDDLPDEEYKVRGIITIDYYDAYDTIEVVSVVTSNFKDVLRTNHHNFIK
jgi:hypothetical protein